MIIRAEVKLENVAQRGETVLTINVLQWLSGNHLEENDVQYVILPEPKCLTGIRIDEHQALRIRSMDYQSTNRYDQWSNIDFTIGKESITFQNYINTASLRIIRNPETDPKNKPELLDRLIYCPADHQYQNESKKRKMFNQSVLERMIGASRYKRQSQGLASKLIKTTRLALADSPYEVNSLVIVPENVDLVIEQGVTLYFEPGTGFLVRGHLIADGTFNRVIKMLPKDANSTWNGLVVETTKSFSGQNSRTVLKSLVINNAYIGLLIRGYDFPFIEDLTVAASTRDGLVVDSDFILNVTIRKCRLINNKGYGIRIKTGESTISVSINEILIAGSELTGFLLESSTTSKNLVKMIDIRNAAFFNNGWNGLDVQANYEKFQIDRTISASNGKYAIFFKTADEETLIRRSSVQISRLNVTGHWYNAALVVESSLSTFSIGRSNFWENYNGCMKFVGCMKLISIFENQYSRNRNGIISINSTCPNSSISIIRNNYTLNLLNNRILNQSIVAIHNNLAPNIITLSSSKMNLTKNMLDNPISVCEIRILNSTMVPMENFADNIWADVNAILPGKKICLSSIKDVQNDEDNVGITGVLDVATFTSMDSKAEGMVPESLRQNMIESMTNRSMVFRARNESYKIETSLFIRNGSTMIVEPGTTLEIWPNQGIYVFGRLIANGTPNEPIIFRSRSLETWSGIYLDNDDLSSNYFQIEKLSAVSATENSSVLKYCILDRSNQGLILRSNNVILSNCVISRPKFAGVTLVIDNNSNNFESKNKKFSVQNHFVSFNFDSTKIMESQGSGLKIINSKYPIEIRSLIAEKVSGNCIDLENDPKFDIRILNSSFSDCQRYAVSIERLIGGSNQTLMLSENLIANQRGLGGVYVSGIDYGTVIVENNTFRNSLVPNLIIILKCNPWTEYVPKFDLIGNKFNLNEDLSADVRLIDCVEANITRNWFNDNNNYRHKGAFRLEIEPSPVIVNQSSGDKFNIDFRRNTFTANKGDFSVYFLTDNMNRFRSNVQFNYFRTNENRRSSLILGSPLFFVHENQFLDEKYGHKLEVEFSDDGRYLDASNNYWSTDNETEISESILDGRKIQGRGKVTFKPFLNVGNETEFMIDVPVDYNIGKNSSSVETSTLPNTPDCSSLKFCHYNGLCISNNICLCSTGYTGLDCRFFTCSTLNNCNGNGRCTGPNLCSCYEGWFGRRCDSANCSSLHECHGHGTCVSYNECECFHDYMGVDCNQTVNESTLISSSTSVLVTQSTDSQLWSFSTTLSVLENVDQNMSFQVTTAPAYCSFCNYRGRCLNEQLCLCAAGWYGRRCELANCSQVSNCSGRGLCAGPNVCQCFIGYVGEDCSTCSNGHCAKVACDKPCLHGMCDYANGTCLCKNGWTGDECGLCENGADPHTNCRKNETQITYIFTKNLDIENTILYVHGQDLPNNSVCKLDSGIMNSVWISPEYMILSHAKPICNSGTCSEDHGSCVENLCFCDAGWKNRCEEKIVTPEMEVLSLSNISSWQEGRPLDIDFHIQNKSLKAHWQSVKIPNGATIDPETGIFHWPKPIGSNYPINITVSATTALGTSNGSYSINIRPSYTPILDQVLITSDNLLSFNGTINFDMNSSSLSKAIVDVLSYYESEDGRIVTMKIPTIADDQDQFYGEFLLDDDLLGKNLKIVACHPADCDSIVENGVDILGLKYITYDVQGLRIDPKFTSLSYDFETGQTDFQLMVENFYLYKISNIQLLARHFPTFIDWKSNATNFDLEPMEKQLIYVHIENLSSFEGFLRFEIDSPETASKYTIVELNPTISNRTRLNINGQIDTNYQFNGNNHGVITRIRAPCRGPSIADCNISIDIPPTSGLFQISRIANQRNVTGDSWFLIGYKNVSSEIIGAANESQIRLLSNGLLTQSLKFSFTPATSPTKINFKVFGEMIDSVDNQLHKIVLSLVDIQLTMFNETQHLTTDDYGMATALISNCCYGVQLRKEGYETYSTNLVIPILLNFEFFMKLLRPTSRFVVEAVYDDPVHCTCES
uniref:EGF-like domain-containing protein n=1 Tax=Romanomermis culicivorax TaxID=13658 RepID=A0A915L411_ROMCU